MKKVFPLLFVLVFNLWLLKVFTFSPPIAVVVILASLFIFLSIKTNKRKYFYLSMVLVLLLVTLQHKTSSINSLVFLNENEEIHQRQRMRGYPPGLYRFANWFEQRKEALVYYKMEENFSEVADPNLYFFANHPRERIGVVEYEKFPYILLPFFVLGLLWTKKSGLKTLLLSTSPVILLSLIGNSNPAGPFSLFPFLATHIAIGLDPVFKNKKHFFVFILIFSLVFTQTISYAKY